ncbi:ATPase, T2SS/T4P/T4SS family [Virgibacillus halophilus]|uniref:ATPase, T2SS/T4P/T4SS family n=1 Tax=Tigheibacillus halophilus TaxID=361280 RepID=A0ABU5CBH2_9BACI|nr:ATPase, T2SS/T4P/T4SS family [Virgibacillus halophilus]
MIYISHLKGGDELNPASVLGEKILAHAIGLHASDIHFYPFAAETKIYIRVHGKRIFYLAVPTIQYELLLTYYKFTSGMDIGETRKPQNGVLFHQTPTNRYHLRLSTLPVNKNESLAIRLLPQEKNIALKNAFLFPYQLKKTSTMDAVSCRFDFIHWTNRKRKNLYFIRTFTICHSRRLLPNHHFRRPH